MKISVVPSAQITELEKDAIAELFQQTYDQADVSYLEKSAVTFRHLALAKVDGKLVGFCFGDSIFHPLPRMNGEQTIALAGIGCIDASQRRQGLFTKLMTQAMMAGGAIIPGQRMLFAGRMAHIITYNTMAHMSQSTIPSTTKPISDWHQEVGLVVAGILGSELNPENFVVQGSGKAVGYPKVKYQTSAEEDRLFAAVDREQGDSLLTMCWMPDAPHDW